MALSRKQVAFDMDTNALKDYYPKDGWNYAYEIIKRHMNGYGFDWLQGSVYHSRKPMSSVKVLDAISDLIEKHQWINVCMRDCVQTNIGRDTSLNNLFDKDADIPKREK
jgi:virulence-associated protein VapD